MSKPKFEKRYCVDNNRRSAVIAGGTADSVSMPAPLIIGTKVCIRVTALQVLPLTMDGQGDTFRINVIDQLTDNNSMLTTTSIVSTLLYWIMNQTFNRGV